MTLCCEFFLLVALAGVVAASRGDGACLVRHLVSLPGLAKNMMLQDVKLSHLNEMTRRLVLRRVRTTGWKVETRSLMRKSLTKMDDGSFILFIAQLCHLMTHDRCECECIPY